MSTLLLALNYHIVHIHLHVSSYLGLKHLIRESWVDSLSIHQAERHDFVTKQSLTSDKGWLLLIRLMHLDLIVS